MVKAVFRNVAAKQRSRTRLQARVGSVSAGSQRRANSSGGQGFSGSGDWVSLHAIRSDSRFYSRAWPLGRRYHRARAGLYWVAVCPTRTGSRAQGALDTRSRPEMKLFVQPRQHLTIRCSRRLAGLFPPVIMIKILSEIASRALASRG